MRSLGRVRASRLMGQSHTGVMIVSIWTKQWAMNGYFSNLCVVSRCYYIEALSVVSYYCGLYFIQV